MKIAHSVAGACVVRNARDIIGLICGHYLRIGCGHVSFVDDGSTDGTYEFLDRLSSRTDRISVVRVTDVVFQQEMRMNDAINRLIANGHSLILPFDSDEFWNIEAPQLEERYANLSETVFMGRWVNFVQNRPSKKPSPFGLLGVKYRSGADLDDDQRHLIQKYIRPFIDYRANKLGFKTQRPVRMRKGQHEFIEGPKNFNDDKYEVFHIPLRYRTEILRRGLDHESRVAPLRSSPDSSWQFSFHQKVIESGKIDNVWAANSADRQGLLDCYGKPVKLVLDRRLQSALSRAWKYMFWQKYRS